MCAAKIYYFCDSTNFSSNIFVILSFAKPEYPCTKCANVANVFVFHFENLNFGSKDVYKGR